MNRQYCAYGKTLREIIDSLGGKFYKYIEFRCEYTVNGILHDDLYGVCEFNNRTLIPLDHDIYSLDDCYDYWQEYGDILTVWEKCEVGDD